MIAIEFIPRTYKIRQWCDVLEMNCMDKAGTPELEMFANVYWFGMIVVLVWIPTTVMMFCYGLIFWKLKQSTRQFPYLSGKNEFETLADL